MDNNTEEKKRYLETILNLLFAKYSTPQSMAVELKYNYASMFPLNNFGLPYVFFTDKLGNTITEHIFNEFRHEMLFIGYPLVDNEEEIYKKYFFDTYRNTANEYLDTLTVLNKITLGKIRKEVEQGGISGDLKLIDYIKYFEMKELDSKIRNTEKSLIKRTKI